MTDQTTRAPRLAGPCLALATVCVVAAQFGAGAAFAEAARALAAVAVILLAARLPPGRLAFLAVGALLVAAARAAREDWGALVADGLSAAAFVAAFFTATTALRHAAIESEAIRACGRFLAEQPPGRRYAALSLGGHLFGIPLNYGALALLGGMAETSARAEPDAELRAVRLRRMLLAIHRGFAATLAWSPLSFAMAISTAVVPGARWSDAAGAAVVTALILGATGWAVDATISRPSAAVRARALAAPPPPSGLGWSSLRPLWALLGLIGAGVWALGAATGVGAVPAVMVLAPALSLGWVAAQRPGAAAGRTAEWARRYVVDRLPEYRAELVILAMAAFIGSLGGALLAPVAQRMGLDLSAAPGWVVLVGLVWAVPLMGQFAMNPILSVSLLAPLLPAPAALGLAASDMVLALTAGWALAAVSSPYTASTLVLSAIAGVAPRRVGVVWNGAFVAAAGGLVTLWVVLRAAF
jgi:hypothetical protein